MVLACNCSHIRGAGSRESATRRAWTRRLGPRRARELAQDVGLRERASLEPQGTPEALTASEGWGRRQAEKCRDGILRISGSALIARGGIPTVCRGGIPLIAQGRHIPTVCRGGIPLIARRGIPTVCRGGIPLIAQGRHPYSVPGRHPSNEPARSSLSHWWN